MFRVNKENTGTASMTSIVSVVDFEQVNVSWVKSSWKLY